MQRLVTLLLAGLFVCNNLLAQTDSLLAKARVNNPFEEVFVHTDKNNYVSGETIWLKAYLYDGMYPSTQSANISIELVNSDSGVIARKTYPVISGISNGSIKLPAALPAGRYYLRTTGDGLLHAGTAAPYIAPLTIYNPIAGKKPAPQPYTPVATAQLHFAGNLTAGISNQVCVTVTDQYKQPIQTDGVLLSGSDTAAFFTTDKYGIAEMQLIPEAGAAYSISLANGKGPVKVPAIVQPDGITMSISYRDNTYSIFVTAAAGAAAKQYTLAAEYNYSLVFKTNVTLNNGAAVLKIPTAKLPAGIIRLALLTGDDDAACERYIFSNNSSVVLGVKEAVANISSVDTAISVVRVLIADSVENTASLTGLNDAYNLGSSIPQDNIINRFLLSGYFNEYSPVYNDVITDLQSVDVHAVNELLATQQLLKPTWQQLKILAVQKLKYDESNLPQHLNIKGTVTPDGYKNLPDNASLTTMFSMKDSSQAYQVIPLDASGKFEVPDLVFTDSVTMYYKLNGKTPKPIKLSVEVNDPASAFKGHHNYSFIQAFTPVQLVDANGAAAGNTNNVQAVQLQQYAITDTGNVHVLANVTVTATKTMRQKQKEVNDRYTTDVFMRDANQSMDLINNPYKSGLMDVLTYLRFYGRQMSVGSGDDPVITKPGSGFGAPLQYTVFLDANRTFPSALKNIDIRDVALIKIYASNFVMADNNGPAIAIFMRNGKDIVGDDPKTMQKISIPGYSSVKNFTIADVDNRKNVNPSSLLGTFYWNPYVNLVNTGTESTLTFCNISHVKNATVILQGMASDGRLIYWQKQVQAK